MNLNDLSLFVRVVEEGSFTAAAERLNLPKSSVSRTLSRLEAGLGVRLLQRTTRSLHLTDAGRQFYERIRRNLDDIADAERALSEFQSSPRGHLRITLPIELGMRFMGGLVADFMQRYPEVSIEAELSSRLIDLVEEGVDLGLRIGHFNDANLIGRRIGMLRGRFYASPSYIVRHGMPTDIASLSTHEFVLFRQARENILSVCDTSLLANIQPTNDSQSPHKDPHSQAQNNYEQVVLVRGRLSTNNAHLQLDAIASGLGIGLLPAFVADTALSEGRLVSVLPHAVVNISDLWVMTPSRAHMSSALRTFLDFLVSHIREHPWFE